MRGYEIFHDLKKVPGVEHRVSFPRRKTKAQSMVRSGEARRHGKVYYIVLSASRFVWVA